MPPHFVLVSLPTILVKDYMFLPEVVSWCLLWGLYDFFWEGISGYSLLPCSTKNYMWLFCKATSQLGGCSWITLWDWWISELHSIQVLKIIREWTWSDRWMIMTVTRNIMFEFMVGMSSGVWGRILKRPASSLKNPVIFYHFDELTAFE